jgi:citrate synthase
MMFDSPVRPYVIDRDLVKGLEVFWILHADHGQNCSTAAVRLVGSARVNPYAAISAGLSALWGPLHGGANQAVIEMLQKISDSGGDPTPFIARAKDKKDPFRLMGFGHRVYKTYDPRARIMEGAVNKILKKLHRTDPLLDIAKKLEEVALKDSYFIDHNLYPNLDFYSGIFLKAIGIPLTMFTVMFAIGRLPGWISQWKESRDEENWKIQRPRQIYVGQGERSYVSMKNR